MFLHLAEPVATVKVILTMDRLEHLAYRLQQSRAATRKV